MVMRRRLTGVLAALLLVAGACSTDSQPDSGQQQTAQTDPIAAVDALTTLPPDQASTTTTGPRKESTGELVYGWHKVTG